MIYNFEIGKKYKRKDIYRIIGISEHTKGGNWDTGYAPFKGEFFVFCNVGVPGRTGHDYDNRFIGDDLLWRGKTSSNMHQPMIKKMTSSENNVYVFYRTNDKDPFTFGGIGKAKEVQDTVPVTVLWTFDSNVMGVEEFENSEMHEGSVKTVKVNIYERNPIAREICLKKYGYSCTICGFDFFKVYGELGRDFIHVHHLLPISEIKKDYVINPEVDLVPVCPNCHAMIHKRKPAISIAEIMQIIKNE